jgi:hypothetical protein
MCDNIKVAVSQIFDRMKSSNIRKLAISIRATVKQLGKLKLSNLAKNWGIYWWNRRVTVKQRHEPQH